MYVARTHNALKRLEATTVFAILVLKETFGLLPQ